MGMDVWVMKMQHVGSPKGILRDFLRNVSLEALYEGSWGGQGDGNVFFEMFRDDFLAKAKEYSAEKRLSQKDTHMLISWVEALPWEDDSISLNIN